MASIDNTNLWDSIGAQYRNNSRLAFELQFRAVKKRLNTELNAQKEIYNNFDNTPTPRLAELTKERQKIEERRKDLVAYLTPMQGNVRRIDSLIRSAIPNLSAAASDVGPDAEATFNRLRDSLNQQLLSFAGAKNYSENLIDQTSKFKGLQNPSGIKSYADYASISDRVAAIGQVIVQATPDQEVVSGLSSGFAKELGYLRSKMLRDFDLANGILGKAEPKVDSKGKAVLDKNGKQITVGISGLLKTIDDLDKRIEKTDAEDRLVVLKQVQALEKKNDNILQSMSLNFEFAMGNADIFATRSNLLKPQKGSIMNLFI